MRVVGEDVEHEINRISFSLIQFLKLAPPNQLKDVSQNILLAILYWKLKCVHTSQVGNEHNSAESYSKVVGISGASSSKPFAGANSNNIVKIEESLLIEDLKEEESTTYIQLKHESKESEVVKNETNTETDYKAEAKNQAVLNNLFNPNEINKLKGEFN